MFDLQIFYIFSLILNIIYIFIFICINRKSKEFKDLKSNLSKALGLTDITVTDETLLDVIDLFVANNDITEVEALDRMEELSKYIEDYFGFNTKYTPDSDLQEQYDEWLLI